MSCAESALPRSSGPSHTVVDGGPAQCPVVPSNSTQIKLIKSNKDTFEALERELLSSRAKMINQLTT